MSDELQDRINSLLKGEIPDTDKEAESEDAMPSAADIQSEISRQVDSVSSSAGASLADDINQEELKKKNLNMILDIPLEVSVELGRNKMLINDLLQLGQGSIIELNKLAGEPLEVLVNGRLIARGEVVVIHDKFGVRLTDIISANERITQLTT